MSATWEKVTIQCKKKLKNSRTIQPEGGVKVDLFLLKEDFVNKNVTEATRRAKKNRIKKQTEIEKLHARKPK